MSPSPEDRPPLPATVAHAPPVPGPARGAGPAEGNFGDYELRREIGRGRSGIVYLARQVSLDRVVALKVFHAEALPTAGSVRLLRTQAGSAALLDHPAIVRLLEVGEHKGRHYVALAHVESESLEQRMRRGPLPLREAVAVVRQVAEAIHYARLKGVGHPDLRPGNVLVDAAGGARVIGLGLAGMGLPRWPSTHEPPVERAGYLAPEEAGPWSAVGMTAQQAAARTDVYHLGALLYVLLTGRPPFRASTARVVLGQVRDAEPTPPSQLAPKVPAELDTICLKCLEKRPRRRYVTSAALMGDLLCWLGNRPIKAQQAGGARQALLWGRRQFRRGVWVALVVLAVAGPEAWRRGAALVERRRAWAAVLDANAGPERHGEALRYYESARARHPRDRSAQIGLGIARYRAGQHSEVAAAFNATPPRYFLSPRTEALAAMVAAMADFHAGNLEGALAGLEGALGLLRRPHSPAEGGLLREAAVAFRQRQNDPSARTRAAAARGLELLGQKARD